MSNQADLDVKDELTPQEVGITPSGESVLAELGIDPVAVKSIKPLWKRTRYRAVINWLTKYKSQPDPSNLDEIRGCLEAFHHLCEVEDWDRGVEILGIRLDTPINKEWLNR